MTNTFIDASVLMELMFKRQKFEAVVNSLTEPDKRFYATGLSVHLLYHFGQKAGLSTEVIAKTAALAEILPLDGSTVKLAQLRYTGKDFEDCLQAACAEAGKCDEIITLDRNFKKHSGTKLKVTVL